MKPPERHDIRALIASPCLIQKDRAGRALFISDFSRRAVDPAAARDAAIERVTHTEASFRYALNEDAMATEKLAEGIRAFAGDAGKLDALIRAL